MEVKGKYFYWYMVLDIFSRKIGGHEVHRHSGLKFVTPMERHDGVAQAIIRQREQVYAQAKTLHPERWAGDTRNWKLADEVWLNPERSRAEKVRSGTSESSVADAVSRAQPETAGGAQSEGRTPNG